jgi:hypothetical protein
VLRSLGKGGCRLEDNNDGANSSYHRREPLQRVHSTHETPQLATPVAWEASAAAIHSARTQGTTMM